MSRRLLRAPNRNRPSRRPPRPERNRRKPDWLAAVRVVLLLALAGQTLRVVFTSPRLRIRHVQVSGTARYNAAELTRMARIPVGANLFRVNLARVSERLQQEPALQAVMVTRMFPDTIRIEARERVPALQVTAANLEEKPVRSDSAAERENRGVEEGAGERGSGGVGDSSSTLPLPHSPASPLPPACFHADAEGVVFEPAPALTDRLPVLQVPSNALPALGQALPPEVVETVWNCARLAKKEKLALGKMRIDEAGELWLNIQTTPTGPESQGGLEVRIGRSTELPEKFRDIRQCLAGWPQLSASAAYLNVMSAGNPARMELKKDSVR